jgi:hypothetical protein
MKLAGKDSSAALATVSPLPTRMLQPPCPLTVEQSKVWASIVACKPTGWFDAGSLPLVLAYCRDTVEADRVAAKIDAFEADWLDSDEGLKRYERLSKLQAALHKNLCSLSVKLRLSPSAHKRADGAEVEARRGRGNMPWISDAQQG